MYRVPITPQIRALLSRHLGADFNPDAFSVYEIMSNNSAVIDKSSDMWKDSRMSRNYLNQMAETAYSRYVPLIELHDKHGRLPVGRIFDAQVFENTEGLFELHALAYLPRNNDPESLDGKISMGVVNEVSSGSFPQQVVCSQCNFDYTKDEASMEYLNLERKWDEPFKAPCCPDGHTVGENGVGLLLNTLKSWEELSVVTRGAVTSARFLQEKEWKLSKKTESLHLAASSKLDKLHFNAHTEISITKPNIEDNPMTTVTIPVAEYNTAIGNAALYTAQKAETERLQTQVQTLNTEKTQAEQNLAAKDAELTTAKAELAAKVQAETDKDAEITRLKTELAVAKTPEGGASRQPGDDIPEANFSSAADDFKR